MQKLLIFLTLTLTLCSPLFSLARPSSFPYISGDTFRSFCDFVYDEEENSVIPELVEQGDTIFVNTDFLDQFFTLVDSKIAYPYVLVTHNSNRMITDKYREKLEDPKIIAWFSINVAFKHRKLIPIPLGLKNAWEAPQLVDTLEAAQQFIGDKKNFIYWRGVEEDSGSFSEIAQAKFVISQMERGIDSHFTWEALYLGAVPVLSSTPADAIFEGLPVLIIKDWGEVTNDFLVEKWEAMQKARFKSERMYVDYWLNKIYNASF